MNMTIPFHLRGKDGAVTIEYTRNDEPLRWGCDLLGPDLPPDGARGFPVCSAFITYEGEGYDAVMGWIQIIQYHQGMGRDILVDMPPQLTGAQSLTVTGGFVPPSLILPPPPAEISPLQLMPF